MERPSGLVIGTAGHIDHGKTSLVHALTGIDTDRLVEEKQRGISIDLGFAHLTLPNGAQVSFVDVPGHERFIKNMLAGACGIEAVLLIVAADESVKPQTREHFDICRLLGIQRGIIVLTKSDLVAAEKLETTRDDLRRLSAGSFLDGAPIVAVSAKTGQGLDELKRELTNLAAPETARDRAGLTRLPIDRSFSIKGFGTVITGTLWSGTLQTGQTVFIHPLGKQARIRGLQVHGKAVEAAIAGQRTAVNLLGIEHLDIERGFVVTTSPMLETSRTLDVAIDWLDSDAVPNRLEHFFFHFGTAEMPCAVKLLPLKVDERRTLGRTHLTEPALALPGDRFILRRMSPMQTVAGGVVLDAFPPRRLNRARTSERLRRLLDSDLASRLKIVVAESKNGRTLSDLCRLTGQPAESVAQTIAKQPELVIIESAQRVVSRQWIDENRRRLVEWLKEFHARNPTAPGAPISQARLSFEASVAAAVFDHFPAIRVQGDLVALAGHRVQFSREETEFLGKIERCFLEAGFQPPALSDVLRSATAEPAKARALLETLIRDRKLVRVADGLIFHADVIAHIRKSLAAHKNRRFTVPEFKSWTNVSRKYAIPLLEYLDQQRITRRDGDARVVL